MSLNRRSFLGVSAGNFLEWLDFTLAKVSSSPRKLLRFPKDRNSP
jgi:hypothetical protein